MIVIPPNIPKIYYQFHQDLRMIFRLNPEIDKMAEDVINETLKLNSTMQGSATLIGIHVQANGPLEQLNTAQMGKKYYENAISAFRAMYTKTLFLVVSDSKESAMKVVIRPQKRLSKYPKYNTHKKYPNKLGRIVPVNL